MSSNHITMVENIWLVVSWPLACKKLLESQFIFHLCHKLIEGLNWPEMVWASTASLLLALPSLQYSEFEYSGQICISGNLLEVFLWFCHKNLCNIGQVPLFSTSKHLRTWDYGGLLYLNISDFVNSLNLWNIFAMILFKCSSSFISYRVLRSNLLLV